MTPEEFKAAIAMEPEKSALTATPPSPPATTRM